jgi:formyltetrahydrofolate hydrolase
VTHADDVAALRRMGPRHRADRARAAVRWHLEDRVIVDGPRTVVF